MEREVFHNENGAWSFATWLEGIQPDNGAPLSHALLFFLYPENYERIVSIAHKRWIVEHYRSALPEIFTPNENYRREYGQLLTLDISLQDIRIYLSRHYQPEIDFYLPPLVQQWKDPASDNQLEDISEPEENNFNSESGAAAAVGTANQTRFENLNLSPNRLSDKAYNYRQLQQRLCDVELMAENLRPLYDKSNSLIGHNNPPIDDFTQALTQKEFEEVSEAITTLREQSETPTDQGQKAIESAKT